MGGGLMQLVAYGAQDIYLTGQPQITFFKSVYRRHTNFSMECIEQTLNGEPAAGQRVTCTVARNGDLLLGAHLRVRGPTFDGIDDNIFLNNHTQGGFNAFSILSRADFEIGGQQIDRIYADWMKAWATLALQKGDVSVSGNGANDPLGIAMSPLQWKKGTHDGTANVQLAGTTLYVPLMFYFERNPGLAVPLIALQYHEVKFVLEFSTDAFARFSYLYGTTDSDVSLWVDYAYLDTTERRKFAQNAHEYLITQHQQQIKGVTASQTAVDMTLNFNHPVKYLMWYMPNTEADGSDALNFDHQLNCKLYPYDSALLRLNNHDRFTRRDMSYFQNMQVYQHWPAGSVAGTYTDLSARPSVYSFALRPAEHQPSGTCNFSRIDNTVLKVAGVATGGKATNLIVDAENYNVLRIMSGMGGLAYSN